ncbi:MAG: hypothetical protein ACOZF0_14790 [Thermodesulfobacteriota bacterium]
MNVQTHYYLIPYFQRQDQGHAPSPSDWPALDFRGQGQGQSGLQPHGGALNGERYRYYLKSNEENDIYNAKQRMVSQGVATRGRLIDTYA